MSSNNPTARYAEAYHLADIIICLTYVYAKRKLQKF